MKFQELQHPNILPFFGIYSFDNKLHLVSPFMENGTLDLYLHASPDADRLKLVSFIVQVEMYCC